MTYGRELVRQACGLEAARIAQSARKTVDVVLLVGFAYKSIHISKEPRQQWCGIRGCAQRSRVPATGMVCCGDYVYLFSGC
jgi:hypothetical protein